MTENLIWQDISAWPVEGKGWNKTKNFYDRLPPRAEGVSGLFYLEGDGLLPDDGESTVDSSHPTDLGMVAYADTYEPVLRRILG